MGNCFDHHDFTYKLLGSLPFWWFILVSGGFLWVPKKGHSRTHKSKIPSTPLFLDVLFLALMLRLILLAILNCRMDSFLAHFGLVCSSYVTISKGSHWRFPHDPLGKQDVTFVRDGNLMTSRIFVNQNMRILQNMCK